MSPSVTRDERRIRFNATLVEAPAQNSNLNDFQPLVYVLIKANKRTTRFRIRFNFAIQTYSSGKIKRNPSIIGEQK